MWVLKIQNIAMVKYCYDLESAKKRSGYSSIDLLYMFDVHGVCMSQTLAKGVLMHLGDGLLHPRKTN